MRIRLHGTRPELVDALTRLRQVFPVASVSRAYPDRSHARRYRVYVDTHRPTR